MSETKNIREPRFPQRCQDCFQCAIWRVVQPYSLRMLHDGVRHQVNIRELSVLRCGNCGELIFDNASDDQVSAALRELLHLLTPEQIQASRMALGLTPEELSAGIGMPAETVSELEERLRIQSRALDNLLRVFFAVPQARTVLTTVAETPAVSVA